MNTVRVGTCGWSYGDWVGPFYPDGTRAADYLGHYAARFDIVEVDSTFYHSPSARTTGRWAEQTPDNFRFTLKMPQAITHEKALLDSDRELEQFLAGIEPLRGKLHSVLLQFGYFNKQAFASPGGFFKRLDGFLGKLPEDLPVAVEIRNRAWLGEEFTGLLRSHRAALAVADQAWMPPVERVLEELDVATGRFVYLRLIGDRQRIEKITTSWDKVVIDRTETLRTIVRALARFKPADELVAFINNHYAGHAPALCRTFLAELREQGLLQ